MVYGTMVLNTMVLITNWLLAFLQCDPFQALFNRAAYPYAKCLDPYIVNMLPIGLVCCNSLYEPQFSYLLTNP